ncbi:alpha/beta fold hydrolase [Kutzneria viridogrisea]
MINSHQYDSGIGTGEDHTTVMAGHTLDSRWIRRFHPSPNSAVRLLCLPHAGGTANCFYPMSELLSPRIEVLSVQYPGRQDRVHEPCLTELSALADSLYEELTGWLDRPLALFGHCMGALVAFEVAMRLERRSQVVPAALFASGSPGPCAFPTTGSDYGLLEDLLMVERAPRGGRCVQRTASAAIRADYAAVLAYQMPAGGGVSCPVTALLGDRDPAVGVAQGRSWSEHTTGVFDFQVYPGGRFYFDSCRLEVAEAISGQLLQDNAVARR